MLTPVEQQQVADFIAANDRFPVVSGYALEPDPRKPAKGGVYTLSNGIAYKLNLAECRALPDGYPRWDL